MQGFKDKVHADMATSFGVQNYTFTPVKSPASPGTPTATPASSAMPAVAAIGATSPPPTIGAVYGPPPPPAPITLNLQVDGQTVATAVHKASSDTAARSFSPVPAF